MKSIADFISARYGKSHGIAALATLLALVGSTPYIALQLKAVDDTFALLTDRGSDSWIQAAKSGAALREIMEQISAVDMQINQVATAAEEQTATTQEISGNMIQITQVVQQTSLGASESARATAQLSDNAEELQRLVSHFKL